MYRDRIEHLGMVVVVEMVDLWSVADRQKVDITSAGGELERSRPTPRIQCL
jgi:hypothetical protein